MKFRKGYIRSTGVEPAEVLKTAKMTLRGLIDQTSQDTMIARDDCNLVVKRFLELMTDSLCSGFEVDLPPLGKIIINTVERNGKPAGKLVLAPTTEVFRSVGALKAKSQEVS